MSFYDGKIPEGCIEKRKDDILNILSAEHKVGKNFNIYNHKYGEITVIPTRTAGNLVLQHGFYPTAYIQPSTSTAVLNGIYVDNPNSQFSLLRDIIKKNFNTIEFDDVENFIAFVDENQNTDWSK